MCVCVRVCVCVMYVWVCVCVCVCVYTCVHQSLQSRCAQSTVQPTETSSPWSVSMQTLGSHFIISIRTKMKQLIISISCAIIGEKRMSHYFTNQSLCCGRKKKVLNQVYVLFENSPYCTQCSNYWGHLLHGGPCWMLWKTLT